MSRPPAFSSIRRRAKEGRYQHSTLRIDAVEALFATDSLSPAEMGALLMETLSATAHGEPIPPRAASFVSQVRLRGLYRRSWSRRNYGVVYARDCRRCRYCGSGDRLSIDHVRPRVLGGSDEIENLVVACRGCNSRKQGRTPEQAGMQLRDAR